MLAPLRAFALCTLVISYWSPITQAAGGLAAQNLAGEPVALGDYFPAGKWTLVMAWTTYCGVCRQQQPMISAFHSAHKDKDAVVLGIALDGFGAGAKVANYEKSENLSYTTVISDPQSFGEVYRAFTDEGFKGTPTYLLFNPAGGLAGYQTGPLARDAIEKMIATSP
ncbi:MAG: TlpA disulfide reductase family protein [Pseudomonadota bacterium]